MSATFRRGSGRGVGVVAIALALLVAACGGAETSGDFVLDIPADAELASPAPDPPASASSSDPQYEALDLSRLGGNASTAPSAIPSDLEVGFTEEGYPYRGSADAAVTLVEYSDYACPFCARYTAQNTPLLLEQYGVTGQVRFVFREFPLVGLHPTAPAAHAAAFCAGEEGAELYWAMHDEIFARQGDWTNLPDPADYFAGLAESLGVGMTAYGECIESGRAQERIDADVAEAQQQYGFNGTPSFRLEADALEDDYTLIGALAVESFSAALDAMVAGEAPPGASVAGEPATPEPAGLPAWADRTTGLLPDPERPGYTQAGDQFKGDPEAPLVVIEFSDFQCPFCGDHALEVQPAIDEALVDSGQVMWVYKHLPLNIHPLAPIAGAAAECAADQGAFWEMHHALFEASDAWIDASDTEAALIAVAADVGLDTGPFQTCLAGREALERVLADQAEASGVISSTPSFVVVQGGRGLLIEGSRPADQFIATLQGYIDSDADG